MSLPETKNERSTLMIHIDSSLPAWKIWKVMKAHNRKFLPVIEAGRLLGVVKSADVAMMASLSPGSMDISDILESSPLCVNLAESFQSLLEQLTNQNKDYAVLIDDFGNTLEIVTSNQVLTFMNQDPAPSREATVNEIYKWRLKNGNN